MILQGRRHEFRPNLPRRDHSNSGPQFLSSDHFYQPPFAHITQLRCLSVIQINWSQCHF